jgi:hypothetical protein
MTADRTGSIGGTAISLNVVFWAVLLRCAQDLDIHAIVRRERKPSPPVFPQVR